MSEATVPVPAPTSISQVEKIAQAAAAAAPAYAKTLPNARARALCLVAERLEAAGTELIRIAAEETGLTETRLAGELKRTCVQLKLFASTVEDGAYLDARIDEADPGFVLGPRPDIRRVLEPLGPVLNFSASNFPFAFSVAGGDTAAALAAGCPVIVKAHSGHPRLSDRTGAIVSEALESAGMPAGTLQVVFGQAAGTALLKDPRIKAGSFTGSQQVGRMLADVAAARPAPIPFFGELGSVNPVFVSAAALDRDAFSLATGYYGSVSGSAGQLCTKPGFLFVPEAERLTAGIREAAAAAGTDGTEHRLLNASISRGFAERRETVLSTAGVEVILEGSCRLDEQGLAWTRPTIVSVPLEVLEKAGDRLLEEAFGPLSIIVEYGERNDLAEVVRDLFPGNLTGTVHIVEEDEGPALESLVEALAASSGRVIFNGWPTGVAVTPAMQHGGPWPATTSDGTSVGTAAIGRFLRAVAYQNAPQWQLPEALRDNNPWNIPRALSPAGSSATWGNNC
ncbi:aldehyde dehydrogenase [Arthrobacter crystallopoietes BAB-32]|uniref:Aldehyde dehydrogenase n=1 Tax=Arthrobacter crystallopoietes BAB-32 TaxID=1246476 RepID=N1V479_9MICC|nr:aldehyde dehydrogenase (NADP(+)) [Arthrobacter crystallopoietes]EMY36160.1 aldehyde dehydrogenase [Arthrobacter crystallopoietes BAB-32]